MSENLFEGEPTESPAAEPAPTRGRGRPPGDKAKAAKNESAETADLQDPVVAVCKITYGKGQSAVPGDIFRPTSQDERDYLLKIEAVEELGPADLALFEKMNG